MKCLLLAAGYATRLYPLTENFPKPLLKVGEKSILDWLIDDIRESKEVDQFIVISNHKFAPIFENWAKEKKDVVIVDDGTSTNETRLGAVKDIQYAIEQLKLDDDLLVLAGDNVLDFSLNKFIAYCQERKASCVFRYFEKKKETLTKRGVLELGENDLVLSMEEKPAVPKTQWCCPPFYYYSKEDMKKIPQALEEGCGYDAPGSFISWLCKQTKVYAMEMPGSRYDIGNLQSYEEVQKNYRGITK